MTKTSPTAKSRQSIQLGQPPIKIPYTLIRSPRAKRLSLKINPHEGLEVVVPKRHNLSHVPGFIHDKKDWVLKHLSELKKQKAKAPKLRDGTTIDILGAPCTLRILPTRKKSPYVKVARALRFASDKAYYDGTETVIYANTYEDAKKALEKHLRALAKKHFARRTAELANLINSETGLNLQYNRISIKGQKSRWGSCSRQKNLNFNWRLVFASPPTIDSIIIHELAHLKHLDHSRKFYDLVETFCPDHRQLSKQLQRATFLL